MSHVYESQLLAPQQRLQVVVRAKDVGEHDERDVAYALLPHETPHDLNGLPPSFGPAPDGDGDVLTRRVDVAFVRFWMAALEAVAGWVRRSVG